MRLSAQPRHVFTHDGVEVFVYHVNKGEGLPKHEHENIHITICHNGSCRVSLEGRSYTITKESQALSMPSNEWHEIEALEDNTVFVNIFSEGKIS